MKQEVKESIKDWAIDLGAGALVMAAVYTTQARLFIAKWWFLFTYIIGVSLVIFGGSYYIHCQQMKLYHTSFVLGCTWDGKATAKFCEDEADKYVQKHYAWF